MSFVFQALFYNKLGKTGLSLHVNALSIFSSRKSRLQMKLEIFDENGGPCWRRFRGKSVLVFQHPCWCPQVRSRTSDSLFWPLWSPAFTFYFFLFSFFLCFLWGFFPIYLFVCSLYFFFISSLIMLFLLCIAVFMFNKYSLPEDQSAEWNHQSPGCEQWHTLIPGLKATLGYTRLTL